MLSMMFAQAPEVQHAAAAAQPAAPFNPGEVILEHVSNSSTDHAIIHLPPIFGIDMSVTKHVLMLWLVAALLFVVVTGLVRRYLRNQRMVPSGLGTLLEIGVGFVRDGIVRPNVGRKWTDVWTPLLLTFFLFILTANTIGLVPIFDVLGLIDHFFIHSGEHSVLQRMIHGGSTATGNFNVTAGLAVISFVAIIIAGTRAHGFVQHWKNIVPHGMAWPIYILLIPIEILSLFVRPFALTMRLAANMTGGHIAMLAIMSFIFIFAERVSGAFGIGIGLFGSVPLSVAMSGLELIVVLVQAYVFTLLTAVFIGMAIHAHH